jgi:hypothetical protein
MKEVDTMAIAETNMIIHGVGTAQLVFKDGSFLDIEEAQDLEINVEATTQEVEGGDSYFALLEFITKKTGKVSITDANFSLAQIKALTGAKITSAAEVLVPNDVKTVATGTCTLSKTTGVIIDTVKAKLADTGEVLTQITTGTPTASQFKVTALGVVTVDTALNGKSIVCSYYYTDSAGAAVNMLENDVPRNCELRHQIITDEMPDGKRYRVDICVYACKPSGAYNYSAKRGAANAPKMEFKILKAGRADKRTVSYNVTEYTE